MDSMDQELPKLADFFEEREDVPPSPFNRTDPHATTRGGQAHLLMNPPATEGTAITQIRYHADHLPTLTSLFEGTDDNGTLVDVSLYDIFERFRLKPGRSVSDNGHILRSLSLKPPAKGCKIDDIRGIVKLFLYITDRAYEFALASALNGETWQPQLDTVKALAEVVDLTTFRTLYERYSKTTAATRFYSKSENWKFKPTEYRKNGFIHFLMTQVSLALDQIHFHIMDALRSEALHILQSFPIQGLEIGDPKVELPDFMASQAASVLQAIQDDGNGVLPILWSSPAVVKVTNLLLNKMRKPYIARALYKTQASDSLTLPFRALALGSTIIISKLLELSRLPLTNGYGLIRMDGPYAAGEKCLWTEQGKLLRELELNVEEPEILLKLQIRANLRDIMAAISTNLNVESYYA